MNKNNHLKTDPNKRSVYKEIQRKSDLSDLITKRQNGKELQKRNSFFTNIDWSEIKIFESNGYSWQPKNKTINTGV
ncbi:MAG: hypothetical protein V2I97_25475 [Desulfococcaceae bacterium]|jgi:hypothetical protein|nr:hypothetical protein [Desulfococcaceae bacterium]